MEMVHKLPKEIVEIIKHGIKERNIEYKREIDWKNNPEHREAITRSIKGSGIKRNLL